jgi:hypothetical protein
MDEPKDQMVLLPEINGIFLSKLCYTVRQSFRQRPT